LIDGAADEEKQHDNVATIYLTYKTIFQRLLGYSSHAEVIRIVGTNTVEEWLHHCSGKTQT